MWQYLDILREKAKFFLFFLGGCGEEKYKYFKPQPDIQQLTRLLLQFYVTIFGHFRGKSQKKIFYKALERKNSSIPSPDRIFNSWQGFYCSFMWQYLDILREKAKIFFFFRRLWRGKIQVFQAPTGYSTADKAFIAVLCDNILAFEGEKAKKNYFRTCGFSLM